uniref:Uncharacterized protein n=1 Tax=Anguilla anguilla TaxID=7936 RepID=A0A0E9XMZ2_ANGAN
MSDCTGKNDITMGDLISTAISSSVKQELLHYTGQSC